MSHPSVLTCSLLPTATTLCSSVPKRKMLSKKEAKTLEISGYLTSDCCCAAICHTVDDIFGIKARLA